MADVDKRVIVDGVEVSHLVRFPKILTAVTSSLQPARLIIGLLMVAALITAGRLWDAASEPSEYPLGPAGGRWIDLARDESHGAFEATVYRVTASFDQIVQGVLSLSLPLVIEGADSLLIKTPQVLWTHQKWFTIVFGLVFLVVFAVGGGALSRMAACQTATEERLRIREAFDFALRNWLRLIWAQALPLLITLLIGVAMILAAWLAEVPVLDVLVGILYGLALLVGFLIAFLLIGYILGFPMLIPAVACENCDGADAMQRAYSYVVTRPLYLLGYWLVALIGLALGFLLVSVVAVTTLNVTAALCGALTDNPGVSAAGGYAVFDLGHQTVDLSELSWHERWTAAIVTFWQTVVVCLVAAYVFAYHFGASTIVYLLMRRVCDGQELDEIWQPGAGSAAAGATAAASSAEEKREAGREESASDD